MIPYGRQSISETDIQAVTDVLRSNFLTQGSVVPQFEDAIADYCKVPFAVAVNSATSALHIACLALGVGSGDTVWTTPNTFVASANCARYCGASVDFVDIDPSSYNLCVIELEKKLEQAKKKKKLPKVVIPVHFAGQSCDMKAIYQLSQQYGFHIIEDASHAIGARYEENVVGDCRYSDITVFSFHPVKIITTGEGGLATTKSVDLARQMQLLRSHGITRELNELENKTEGSWYYEQQILGYNYRMTDIQAALGLSQLERLDLFVERRNQLASRYNDELSALPLQLPFVLSGNQSAFHLYVIRLKTELLTKSHRQIFDELREQDIGVNLHYAPVHLQPYYRELGFKLGQYPQAELHGYSAITLPVYPALTAQEQDQVISVVKRVLA